MKRKERKLQNLKIAKISMMLRISEDLFFWHRELKKHKATPNQVGRLEKILYSQKVLNQKKLMLRTLLAMKDEHLLAIEKYKIEYVIALRKHLFKPNFLGKNTIECISY